MKLKLDENLPASLVVVLRGLGHDVDTVPEEGLAGCHDDGVWAGCQHAGRFLVTQDLDFSDIRRFTPGDHCGLLVVRLGTPGARALCRLIETLFREEDVASWQSCVVVATARKLRIRRPPASPGIRG